MNPIVENRDFAIRITGVETIVVNAEMRNWIFIKVLTDQAGLFGWGEASLNWKTRAITSTVEDLAPMLLGQDPRDIEQILRILNKHSYYRLGIIGMTAISGIEHALWDIFGKSVGLPVWRLFGGKARDKLRVYTHLGLGNMRSVYESFDPARVRDGALSVVEKGYDALKVVFIPYTHYTADIPSRRHVGTLMKTLREALGDKIDIMIDFHGRPASTSAALQFIQEIAPYDPMFCEEPVQPGKTRALKTITDMGLCPIASGERLVGYSEFEPIFEQHALNIIQPDLNHTGGLLVGKRIAAAAEQALMGVAPHNPNGPVAGAAALHFGISTPNVIIQEEMSGAVPWFDDVVSVPMRRTGSFWEIPTEPGLGVTLNECEAAKHPFKQEIIHSRGAVLADGTVVNW